MTTPVDPPTVRCNICNWVWVPREVMRLWQKGLHDEAVAEFHSASPPMRCAGCKSPYWSRPVSEESDATPPAA